jgi:2-keto-4-pentenoate hydratase/2-oxohepta-3-ene-1,7-dioic acid hydratase in catechol pathway
MDRVYRLARPEPSYAIERDGVLREVTGDIFGAYQVGAPIAGGLAGATLLPPVRPSKIVCVGFNYKDHAAEIGSALPSEPLLFLKPPSAVIGPGAAIALPPGVGRVDHEAELGVVIGRRAHRVPRARAWDFILGLTCVNDVTARDLQKKESQFTRSKGFDTFAPIGASVAIGLRDEPRAIECWVNGQRRQSSNTKHLLFPIDVVIEYVTFVMTLEPGDVVATGTPEGIGPLVAGDTVTVSIEGVGELSNPVESEA